MATYHEEREAYFKKHRHECTPDCDVNITQEAVIIDLARPHMPEHATFDDVLMALTLVQQEYPDTME